ncbi:uncharacterized protein LOC131877632 isoform X2 [Tigriopus californicus]|uniref:uncharacterized protein LOC131877632 isoform X2 n=1 Tax=Tigriopus californicus TaxID=6832 RepID=UPI0027DA0CF6|nr:uncharacterized protein LOC131877632 isoform X2 [Tigriopus californicus]
MTKPSRKVSFECWSITSSKTSVASKYSPKIIVPNTKTIHALKVIQKSIFILTLGTLILLLLIQTGRCLWRYLEVPTYFASRVLPQSDADFPAITICPDVNDGYKELFLQTHGIESVKKYNYKRDLVWSSNQSGITPRELFDQATLDLDELIYYFNIRTFGPNHQGNVAQKLNRTDNSIVTQYHRKFGRCFTWYPSNEVKSLGIYYITIRSRFFAKAYLHKMNQFLDFNGRMGYTFRPNEAHYYQVAYEDIRTLPQPKSDHVHGETCTRQIYDRCIYSTLERVMLNSSGCVVPFLPSQAEICTSQPGINTTFWIAWNRVTNQLNDCNVPCEVLSVSLSGKNMKTRSDGLGQITLYFQPRVMRSEEHHLYTVLSLLAEIGGYVGLLLGYSLLHAASSISSFLETKIKIMEQQLVQ